MEQSFDNPFTDVQIDTMQGAEIMTMLGLSVADLSVPDKYDKLQTILKYVAGRDGAQYLISKLVAGKTGDRLENAYQYFSLRNKYDSAKQDMEKWAKELELYER